MCMVPKAQWRLKFVLINTMKSKMKEIIVQNKDSPRCNNKHQSYQQDQNMTKSQKPLSNSRLGHAFSKFKFVKF